MQSFKFHFICPFHDFSAQLPYLCPLPPLFTLPRPPLPTSSPCQQITEPNKIILIYMQDESRACRLSSPGTASRCPPARAVFFFFFIFFVFICFFQLSIDSGMRRGMVGMVSGQLNALIQPGHASSCCQQNASTSDEFEMQI